MEPLTGADPPAIREFRVVARLGAGGMGRVYLATSPAGRFVAIKVIQPQFAHDPEFIRRFRGEADAAQRVSGLYTAPVVAAGVDDSPPWLATAFVPGPSLHEVVAKHGPLPAAALWRLAAGLAEALRAIHSAGLVHRDMKPANVLLAPDGPRVIDFGISRAAAASTRMTAAGAAIGTPSYMSPEQVEGVEVGPASDVFSFGSVLAFAATGASPFSSGQGASTPSIMFRVVHGEPALDGLPGDVRAIVAACLAKDPASRPDLGQVAARSTAAVEHLGLSPTAFWPDDVAEVIEAQAGALSRELQALRLPAGQVRQPDQVPVVSAPGFPPAPGSLPGGPGGATWGPPGGPGGTTWPPPQPGYPGQGYPGAQFPGNPAGRGAMPPPRGTSSRRAVLIGGSVIGAAAVVGGGAWALSSLSGGKSKGNATSGSGSLAWRFSATQQPNAPAVAGRLVFFGTGTMASGTYQFYAVNAITRKQAWVKTSSMVSAAPTVVGGFLVDADSTGILHVVHAASGAQAWDVSGLSVTAGQRTWDTDGTRVAVAPGDGSVWLFNAATGKKSWEATSASASWRYVALAAGDVLYAWDPTGGLLSSLSLDTGDQLWSVRMFASSAGSTTGLLAGKGAVYAGTQDGSVYCVDTAARRVRWTYAVPGASFAASDLVAGDGLVYFTDDNSVLRAVSVASGSQAWSYQAGTPGVAPAVADGYVYVPTDAGLQQLHGANGAPGWSYTAQSGIVFNAVAAGAGQVFGAGSDNALYAFRA